MVETRSADAPAKVNLLLRVLARRDDGYHDLQTLIAPISLADHLEVHADADPSFRSLSLSLEVTGEPDLIRGVPRDESNLVFRAASVLADRAGVRGFADVTLTKLVPTAAGLGGGSADAAAVLRALNELWGCGLESDALREVGASVGSDVPALMLDGPVLATGRGERVDPITLPPLSLVLVTFAEGVSTPDAFRWWDEEGSTGLDPTDALRAARQDDPSIFARMLFNDLEGPVVRRRPEILQAKERLVDGGALGAVMSGSGPTVVGVMRGGTDRLSADAEREIEYLSGRPPTYVRAGGSPGS